MKKRIVLICLLIFSILIIIFLLYHFNFIPHKMYSNDYFNIETYRSSEDKDLDSIDDQSDILLSAREYIKTKPKYKSKYYATGYPDDEYGVCTDVVAFSLLGAGYDLMEMVNEDIINNRENYNIDVVDKKIDFRRVRNLRVFFENNFIKLTNDLSKIEEWQGGDIVVFSTHVGIVSDKRNKKGIPFVIHNASPYQLRYEEDILETYGKIFGHYRVS